MDWKEFFRPTKGKLIIFGIFIILYVICWFLSDQPGMDFPVALNILWWVFTLAILSLYWRATGNDPQGTPYHIFAWIFAHILSLTVLYFVSCLIIHLFKNYQNKRKLR